jgi:hypothetical protein
MPTPGIRGGAGGLVAGGGADDAGCGSERLQPAATQTAAAAQAATAIRENAHFIDEDLRRSVTVFPEFYLLIRRSMRPARRRGTRLDCA